MYEELLAELAAGPRAAAHLVAELDEARFGTPAAGDWPPRTILAHLRDDEYLCLRLALERMLAEDDPAVRFIDGADWEAGRNRSRDRKEQLLADYALQRQATLGILALLEPAQWQRAATREGARFTVAELVQGWARHDREHIAQLEAACGETLAQVRERRATWEA